MVQKRAYRLKDLGLSPKHGMYEMCDALIKYIVLYK